MKPLFKTLCRGECPSRLKSDFPSVSVCALVVCLCLGGCAGFSSSDSSGPRPALVFLLAGQSNMNGLGIQAELTPEQRAPKPNVWLWHANDKGWQPLLGGASNKPGAFGPEVALGATLSQAMPGRTIYLIKHAYGGTNLAEQWRPESGSVYAGFIEKTDLALADLAERESAWQVAAMIWQQGERDSKFEAMARSYEQNLAAFVAYNREHFNAPGMPFVFTQIMPLHQMQTPGKLPFAFAPQVIAGQQALARNVPNCHLVSPEGLTRHDDNVHFDTAGQWELGERLAQAYLEIAR